MKADKNTKKVTEHSGHRFFEHAWKESWVYIKTVVDIVREPILILDKDLRVIAANDPFYRTFQVKHKDTEGKIVYKLGNGQWNIPTLKKLLEGILPKHTFFKGFQVAHEFPSIGRKVMILNARQIYYKTDTASTPSSSIILLAIEDVTEMMDVAENLAGQANKLQGKLADRTQKLELHLGKLEEAVKRLKKRA